MRQRLARLHAAVLRAVLSQLDPRPEGHRCGFCARPARHAVRMRGGAPVWWQLITRPTYYACRAHLVWATDAAVENRWVTR